jgi:acyl phosphate:glycerol-3-phosphate acyltransferase
VLGSLDVLFLNGHTLLPLCLIVAAYLCGSLPTGLWAGRRAGVDVRRHGSGNIGATNVARSAGSRAALLTLAGDIAKGLVPVLVARALSMTPWVIAGVGVAALLGHVWSVCLRFSGGKGVATACGAFLGMAPLALAVALLVFAAAVAMTRYVSLASVMAGLALAAASLALGYATPVCAAALFTAAVIALRHRDNLSRLRQGTEPRFQMKR